MSLNVYSAEQMQKWDKYTIEHEPIASIDLMERAATLAAKSILGRNVFSSAGIFCGPGNNGGDGLVIARLLAESGKVVHLYLLQFGDQTEDFRSNFKRLPKAVIIHVLTDKEHDFDCKNDLIIDAIFGSGLSRPIEGWMGEVIQKINQTKIKTIAIDIPSGLFALDNSDNNGLANIIQADETLTFMCPKMAFFYERYYQYVGNFRIIDIGLSPDFQSQPFAKFITEDDVHIERRHRFDHKGTSGCMLLVAGFEQMSGAAIIASKAAMKAGARYLYTSCGEEGKTALNIALPEAIWHTTASFVVPAKVKAIAIGPGLGKSEEAVKILDQVLQNSLPLILDADAINCIAENAVLLGKLPENSILTPHIGELERLIGAQDTPESLLKAQLNFSKEHKVYIIQKGPFSKLTTPQGNVYINSSGNPGMSTAGMGDALTGIIGALLSQGYEPENAAIIGMFVHGYAADERVKDKGEIGLLASEVIDQLPHVLNKFAT
ncbi:MAG: NAD(P)H-hydrate dehydratase [Crocinitomicaceae bacterium]